MSCPIGYTGKGNSMINNLLMTITILLGAVSDYLSEASTIFVYCLMVIGVFGGLAIVGILIQIARGKISTSKFKNRKGDKE